MANKFTHRVKMDFEYYTTDPRQGRPPDGTLKKGAKVRDLGNSIGSYRQVETEDGIECYVSEAALERIT